MVKAATQIIDMMLGRKIMHLVYNLLYIIYFNIPNTIICRYSFWKKDDVYIGVLFFLLINIS